MWIPSCGWKSMLGVYSEETLALDQMWFTAQKPLSPFLPLLFVEVDFWFFLLLSIVVRIEIETDLVESISYSCSFMIGISWQPNCEARGCCVLKNQQTELLEKGRNPLFHLNPAKSETGFPNEPLYLVIPCKLPSQQQGKADFLLNYHEM